MAKFEKSWTICNVCSLCHLINSLVIVINPFGVRALATHPLKSNKKGVGDKNGVVFIGGTRIAHREWCCADSDGVIISPTNLSLLTVGSFHLSKCLIKELVYVMSVNLG